MCIFSVRVCGWVEGVVIYNACYEINSDLLRGNSLFLKCVYFHIFLDHLCTLTETIIQMIKHVCRCYKALLENILLNFFVEVR